jgi:hypothetical protein
LFGKGIKANMVISSTLDAPAAITGSDPKDKLKKQKTQTWDSVVHIILIEGKNLSAKDENGFSDPYVRFKLGNEKHKSKVSHVPNMQSSLCSHTDTQNEPSFPHYECMHASVT